MKTGPPVDLAKCQNERNSKPIAKPPKSVVNGAKLTLRFAPGFLISNPKLPLRLPNEFVVDKVVNHNYDYQS